MDRKRLLGMNPAELKEAALAAGLPAFAGGQLAKWIYQRRVRDFASMTDISKAGREALESMYEIGIIDPIDVQNSKDGTR